MLIIQKLFNKIIHFIVLISFCATNFSYALHIVNEELQDVRVTTTNSSDSILFEIVSSSGPPTEAKRSISVSRDVEIPFKQADSDFYMGLHDGKYFFQWPGESSTGSNNYAPNRLFFILDPEGGLSASGTLDCVNLSVMGDLSLRIEADTLLKVGRLTCTTEMFGLDGALLLGLPKSPGNALCIDSACVAIGADAKIIALGDTFLRVERFINKGQFYTEGKAEIRANAQRT